jgi:benzodiazapine receptor
VVIALLLLAILATTARFFTISKTAGYLMIPYILWVTFASVLNLTIWRLNP